jgi:glycosyltransferase involved in cell wall biosynthesis
MKAKLIRITTIPLSLEKLLSGQLQFMSTYFEVIAVSSEKENLEKLGKFIEVDTFHVEMTRQITPLKDAIAVVKLYFFLKKTKPNIVHTHTPKAGIVGMLAAKLAGVPVRLHTVAGLPLLEATGFKRKILDYVEKLTYKFATKVYPNSFGLLEIIKENNYCSINKLHVIANGSSNGIDTSHFNPKLILEEEKEILRNELSLSVDDFVFIFVGRLVKDKGINELISAFDRLSKEISKVKLLLVGYLESELDPLSNTTLETIKNNQKIISVGFQTDVRPYFSISNVLVFPSYREGFPNVVMQAGAMELPCIVSDINGCNEIITSKINGLIVPVKNQEALLEAMTTLLHDKNLYATLKSNVRKSIVDSYEQKVVWEAILTEYQKRKA